MKGSVHLLVLRPKPRGSPGLLFVSHPTLDPPQSLWVLPPPKSAQVSSLYLLPPLPGPHHHRLGRCNHLFPVLLAPTHPPSSALNPLMSATHLRVNTKGLPVATKPLHDLSPSPPCPGFLSSTCSVFPITRALLLEQDPLALTLITISKVKTPVKT